jgi:PAS domain S-box-containing protein
MLSDTETTNQRLAQFLRWLAPTILGFAIIFGGMGLLFHDWRLLGIAGGIGLHGLLTVRAQVQRRRGLTAHAAYLVGGGAVASGLILTVIAPALSTSLAVVPLLIAAVLLHYAPPHHARIYLIWCFAETILIVLLGEVLSPTTPISGVAVQVLRVSSLLAIILFALILLGQFSSRLQTMLAQLRDGYATLTAQHSALARLSDQHELILTSVGEGIYGVDAQGMVTFANPAAVRMFGCAIADLLGQCIADGSTDTQPDAAIHLTAAEPIRAVLHDGVRQHSEDDVYWRMDGSRFPVEYVCAPIREDGLITGAVVLFRDITERRQAQATLEAERATLARRVEERTADLSAANADLARAARLKDEFLASMSHELRTPLNAILGLSEALLEGIYEPLAAVQMKPIRMMEQSGRHLLELINDILDLAKIGAGKMPLDREPVDIHMLCAASLHFIEPQARKRQIRICPNIDLAVRVVDADARHLKQILVNLLSNAVKFTPEGGTVGLDVTASRDDQVVQFTVWDTGIGIVQEDMARLFQPFTQLDSRLARQYEGSGLGLALAARMVEMHGGSITVESTVGRGSRFTVSLPWNELLPISNAPPTVPSHAQQPTPIPFIQRALIIDDSPTTITQLIRYLRELGVEARSCSNGSDALVQAVGMRPDVILLDIELPNCSGWDVLRQLKADLRTHAIPVLIISVEDQRRVGQTLGASAYLIKPILRPQLQQALGTMLPMRIDAVVQTPFCVTPLSPSANQPLVLLAEDNEVNITPVADYLEFQGYKVVVARNGMEALDRAREVRPDIILMDLQMPKMDGLEATQHIRTDPALATIPVIAITAFAMPGDRERCLAAGADDYMSKPISLRALHAKLETLLTAREIPVAAT